MTKKIPYLTISGSSGIGKSTALENISQNLSKIGYDVINPKRVSTRAVRGDDDDVVSVSPESFEEMVGNGEFVYHYEDFGIMYGISKVQPEVLQKKDVAIVQLAPVEAGNQLKNLYKDELEVTTTTLFAPPEVVIGRLTSESRSNNSGDNQVMQRRIKDAYRTPDETSDYIVNADMSPEEVAQQLQNLVMGIPMTMPLSSLTTTDVYNMEVLHEACKDNNVEICLFGGVAANFHNSKREVTDVDFLLNTDNFDWIMPYIEPMGIQINEHTINIGNIEICKLPIFLSENDKNKTWLFDKEAVDRLEPVKFYGIDTHILSLEDMVVIKGALQRGADQGKFDLFDLDNMLQKSTDRDIDMGYVFQKATKCNVNDKVKSAVSSYVGNTHTPDDLSL